MESVVSAPSEKCDDAGMPVLSSWVRNFESLIEWVDAAHTALQMTPEQKGMLRTYSVGLLEDDKMREVLREWGSDLALLPRWIDQMSLLLSTNDKIPFHARPAPTDLSAFNNKWTTYLLTEEWCAGAEEMQAEMKTLSGSLASKLKIFADDNDSGSYSSYSDYTEDTTNSSEEEDEDENEDDEDEEDEESNDTSSSSSSDAHGRRRRRRSR